MPAGRPATQHTSHRQPRPNLAVHADRAYRQPTSIDGGNNSVVYRDVCRYYAPTGMERNEKEKDVDENRNELEVPTEPTSPVQNYSLAPLTPEALANKSQQLPGLAPGIRMVSWGGGES